MRTRVERAACRVMLMLFVVCGLGVAAHSEEAQGTVRVSVFSLFRPAELRLQAEQGAGKDLGLELEAGGVRRSLPGGAGVTITGAGKGQVRARFDANPEFEARGGDLQGRALLAGGQGGSARLAASSFWLEVPGRLRREYFGTLEIRRHGDILEAIVTMPLEVAVASIAQAESPPGAGMEAVKAQAVAARSFLVARQTGHAGFDFCDTTHCQFLRSPPAAESLAAQAAQATRGLVLTYRDEAGAQDRTLAAMYARSCGGRTRTLRETGARTVEGYPYYAVRCTYCTHHPEAWRREGGNAGVGSERERLAWNRIHGWGAIPSLGRHGATPGTRAGEALTGSGVGHALGLCQLGAADMARHGAGFAQILAHYYPNTRISKLD